MSRDTGRKGMEQREHGHKVRADQVSTEAAWRTGAACGPGTRPLSSPQPASARNAGWQESECINHNSWPFSYPQE